MHLVLAHPRGRLLFGEVKSEKGRKTPDQANWLSTLALAMVPEGYEGQIEHGVHTWRPSDWPEIVDVLTFGRGQ